MLARVQSSDVPLLAILILHKTLAFALGNDKEVICCLTLLYLNLLRLAHHQLNLRDHVVLHLAIERENKILLQLLAEDESSDLFFQRWTDHFKELYELALLV